MRTAPGFEDVVQKALERRAKAEREYQPDELPLRIKLGGRYRPRSKNYPPVRIIAELDPSDDEYCKYGKRFLGDDACTYRPDGGFSPVRIGTHPMFDLVEEAPTTWERLRRWWSKVCG